MRTLLRAIAMEGVAAAATGVRARERADAIGEPVDASLTLAGGTVYIRGEQHLFAIRAAP